MSKIFTGIALLFCGLNAIQVYAGSPLVSFSPLKTEIEIGKEFTLTISASQFTYPQVVNYSINVRYNSLCMQPIEVIDGNFLKFTNATTEFNAGWNKDSITVTANLTHWFTPQAIIAIRHDGTLFSIRFSAIKECKAEIYLENSFLLTDDSLEILPEYQNGTVIITSNSRQQQFIKYQEPSGTLLAYTSAHLDANDGQYYTWGYRNFGLEGSGNNNVNPTDLPFKLFLRPKLKMFTGGEYHILGLDEQGTVISWGQNLYSETGCKNANFYVNKPCVIMLNTKQVAAGQSHSMALDNDGKVWIWGANHFGQLGVNSRGKNIGRTPAVIELMGEKARLIGAAYHGGFAITKEGHVWAWGSNRTSSLALPVEHNKTSDIQLPRRVEALEKYASKIVYIAGGYGWGTALLNDGRVIGWGLHAALGQNVTNLSIYSHEPVVIIKEVKSLFARYMGSFALTQSGELYTWGVGNDCCYNYSVEPYNMLYGNKPTLHSNIIGTPVSIGGGKNHLFYVNDKGGLYGIGSKSGYKLYIKDYILISSNYSNVRNLASDDGSVDWPGTLLRYKDKFIY